ILLTSETCFATLSTLQGAFRGDRIRPFQRPAKNIPSVVQELLEMTSRISRLIQRLWQHDEGATAIEYGLIAALIAVVIIAAITLVGTDLTNVFNQVANAL
ncbi:MAG: Flp family type IVb pilin, partial [Rhodospirillales bacterium]